MSIKNTYFSNLNNKAMVINKIKKCLLVALIVTTGACSSDSNDGNNPVIEVDTENPEIQCIENIMINISATDANPTVSYNTPVGEDNVSATTKQTEGLPSESVFPVGTTTNTFITTDAAGNSATCSFDVIVIKDSPTSEAPFFIDNNPIPAGKKWVKDIDQSDEFDDNAIDFTKWRLTSSGNWIGRAPGLFLAENVSEGDGNLRIKATKLDQDRTIGNNVFTHGGGYVEGLHAANVGLYLECRMKANKTFMSSTFWLNNKRGEGSGCDVRVTELDIQECVGTLTGTSSLALRGWDKIMHSNTHSRSTTCAETVAGSSPKWSEIGENVAENYHVYGAWWKSPREIICYLDGKEIHTLQPKADFNLDSYLRLVVETYDWNPVPADGGMNFTELERTTLYDWVRVWKIEDE